MARVLSDAELDSIEVITTMGSTWTNVLHSIREARRERDAARAALRWLAGECYQETDWRWGPWRCFITGEQWERHVAPALRALGEGA
jgi:hypothetical protein